MALKWLQLLFWAIFDKKKNSRFPLFYRGCELFSTAHFVLASTPTWTLISYIISIMSIYSIIVIPLFLGLGNFSIISIYGTMFNYKYSYSVDKSWTLSTSVHWNKYILLSINVPMCKTLFHTFDIIYQIMCFRQVGQLCSLLLYLWYLIE